MYILLTYVSNVHEFANRLLYVVYELFNNPVVNFIQMCLFVVCSIIWLDPFSFWISSIGIRMIRASRGTSICSHRVRVMKKVKNKRIDFVRVCQVTFHYYKYSLTGT